MENFVDTNAFNAGVKEKNTKTNKNDRIVNIDKEKYENNSLHGNSCYDFIHKDIFVVPLSKNHYKSTVQSQILYVKKN